MLGPYLAILTHNQSAGGEAKPLSQGTARSQYKLPASDIHMY